MGDIMATVVMAVIGIVIPAFGGCRCFLRSWAEPGEKPEVLVKSEARRFIRVLNACRNNVFDTKLYVIKQAFA